MDLIFLIQLLSESRHLTAFEARDLDRSPALGGPGHGGEHELQNGFLTKSVGDDLQAAALGSLLS